MKMKNGIKSDLNTGTRPVSRVESPTMLEIIEKFHRIKEEKFKSKENIFQINNRHCEGRFQRHRDSDISQSDLDRPTSATHKMRNFLTASVPLKRRNSLPSLFKLDTPPSYESGGSRKTGTKTSLDVQSQDMTRRYSTPHPFQEYSKRDIKEIIRAGRRSSLEPLHIKHIDPLVAKPDKLIQTKPDEENEEDLKRWLTGDDLHYFYTMWDIKKKHKLRLPRKLPPVHNCVGSITEEDVARPRLYTL